MEKEREQKTTLPFVGAVRIWNAAFVVMVLGACMAASASHPEDAQHPKGKDEEDDA